MVVCGMEMAGSDARLVLLSGTKADFSHQKVRPLKLTLADDENANEVVAIRDAMFAFFRENAVEKVVIKKRLKRGNYAGGAVGFKLEGIVQLYSDCQIVLLAPATIAAALRRDLPETPSETTQYQQTAFETAFAGLP